MVVNDNSLREMLSNLFPGHAPVLHHLLTCQSCRAWATAELLSKHGIRVLLPSSSVLCAGRTESAEDEPSLPATAAGLTCAAAMAANAHRLEGDLVAADAALANAVFHGAPPLEKAAFHRIMGLIHWERGQFEEAEYLLEQAAGIYGEERQLGEEGATLTLLGLLRLEAGPPYYRTVAALIPGLTALTGERPWMAARGTLALALSFASFGRPLEAEALLEGAREFANGVLDPDEQVRLDWLEGKVLGRLGELENAESLLSSVAGKLLGEGNLAEGVLASFDLGLVLAELGKFDTIKKTAAELGKRTAKRRVLAYACRELRDFRWEDSESRADRLELTALPHRRQFRRRSLGLRPLPFDERRN